MKPVCRDLFCGLGGWAQGFLAEGYEVYGYDIERHDYGKGNYPGHLILRDVLAMHGRECADAAVIVASPPCTEPSYRAMPWKDAVAVKPDVLPSWWALDERSMTPQEFSEWAVYRLEHPKPAPKLFIELFLACFRIQREASEAAGRHIPLIVENVVGAQRWVGRAKWSYGSYYLWGDIPALMPNISKGFKGFKGFNDFNDCEAARRWSSRDPRRKQWSAEIAKIPFPLARHIARVFYTSARQPETNLVPEVSLR